METLLPAVNASLNALATLLLISGKILARQGRRVAHKRVMLSAFAVSCLFLVTYVLHKTLRGFENTPFHGEGLARVAYLAMLLSHLVLAMTVPVLAVAMIRLGLAGRLEAHRRLAKLAWPVWIYVSFTGVAIYAVLYHFNPVPG